MIMDDFNFKISSENKSVKVCPVSQVALGFKTNVIKGSFRVKELSLSNENEQFVSTPVFIDGHTIYTFDGYFTQYKKGLRVMLLVIFLKAS